VVEKGVINRRIILYAGLLAPVPGWAHHGFTGRYDTGRPIWLKGRVERAAFAPPHPVLTIMVENAGLPSLPSPLPSELAGTPAVRPDDVGRALAIEFPPVQSFYRLADRVTVGAMVELIALRNCAPPHQLRSQWIRLADGAVVSRDGRLSYMVNGCG
jgi:hypothetical protein